MVADFLNLREVLLCHIKERILVKVVDRHLIHCYIHYGPRALAAVPMSRRQELSDRGRTVIMPERTHFRQFSRLLFDFLGRMEDRWQ